MLRIGRKFFTTQATTKTLALAIGIWLAQQGTAAGQQPCSVNLGVNWLPQPQPQAIEEPTPPDNLAILALVASYNSALDSGNAAAVVQLFSTGGFTYESCDGSGDRIFQTTDPAKLTDRLNKLFTDLSSKRLQARHSVTDMVLHEVKKDEEVLGQGTRSVTIQFMAGGTPQSVSGGPIFEYTGVLRAAFTKADGDWKFTTLRIHADTPQYVFTPLAR